MTSSSSNQETSPHLHPAIGWLAAAALAFLVATIIWSKYSAHRQTSLLDHLSSEWDVHHPEFVRLSGAEQRRALMETSTEELDGSWRRAFPISDFLADCLRHVPDSITVGKVKLETTYDVEKTHRRNSAPIDPHQDAQVIIAARCFANPAQPEILDLLGALQADPELGNSVQSVILEGVQRNRATKHGLPTHTVFALRMKLHSRTLFREAR